MFQPRRLVAVQAALVVVDEHRRGNVHGIDQHETLLHAAGPNGGFHVWCDVFEGQACRQVERQVFGV